MTPTPGNKPDNADQSPGHKYPIVQRINAKLKVLGDWLMPRVSSAVVEVEGGDAATTALSGLPWVSINGTAAGPRWQFMLGCFDANKTILLVNEDSNHPALATIAMPTASEATMMELHPTSGGVVPALDDSPFLPGFQVALLAGDGRLFTWAA